MTGGDLKEIKPGRSSDNTHRSSLLSGSSTSLENLSRISIDEAIPWPRCGNIAHPGTTRSSVSDSVTEGDVQSYPSQNNKQERKQTEEVNL
jgi:hypothetical protein